MDRSQAKAWLKDFRTRLQGEFDRNPARRNEPATAQAITNYHDVIDRLWAGGGANLSAYKVPAGCTWQQLFDAARAANRSV